MIKGTEIWKNSSGLIVSGARLGTIANDLDGAMSMHGYCLRYAAEKHAIKTVSAV